MSETTREPWGTVWEKNVTEFFNIVVYAREKARREEKNIEAWKKTH